MDLNDIRRRADGAREFAVKVRDMGFTLRLPTQHQVEVAVARARLHEGAEDPALLVRVRRALLEQSVVAWTGVTCEALAPGAGKEAADISPAAVAFLLDADAEVADELGRAFVERRAARLATQETAAKN